MRPGTARPRVIPGRAGMTLVEILVAVLLMATVAAVMYQSMNAAIAFSHRGEARLRGFGRGRALLELLHRQIHAAMFNQAEKKAWIEVDDDRLRLVTRAPLINRRGPVMAFYLFDSGRLYYQERRDYYNPDYKDGLPEERMLLLADGLPELTFAASDDEVGVRVGLAGREYELYPRCLDPRRLAR